MSGKLRFYNEKLQGYKKFYQIVSTIKRVALSKYQAGVARTKTRDYTLRYSKKVFSGAFPSEEADAISQFSTIYIPVCSNRGSCGPLNPSHYRYLNTVVDQEGRKPIHILPIGKKGLDAVPKLYKDFYIHSLLNDDKQAKSLAWANYISENVDLQEADRIQIVFYRFVSAGSQVQSTIDIPSYEKFVEHLSKISQTEDDNDNYRLANAILDLPEETVKEFYDFHRALVILFAVSENELSEHAARIVAVEGQMTNIASLRDQTQMLFNKTRQGAITTALIEILSAMTAMADAQKGSGIVKNEFWAVTA